MHRILHVTEAFGGGVEAVINDHLQLTHDWAEPTIWAVPRVDARIGEQHTSNHTTSVDGHRQRRQQLKTIIKEGDYDAVWVHSSYAGAYVRSSRHNTPIIYTPHCYAFERTDLSRVARQTIRLIERALTVNTTLIAGCGTHETWLARQLGAKAAVTVPNLAPESGPGTADRDKNLIIGIGRVCPQKDPVWFAHVADALRDDNVNMVWVGGGDWEPGLQALENAGVHVTGWVDRADVTGWLNHAAVYLHTAAWEGSPVTLLEAAATDTPAVARNIPAVAAEGAALCAGNPAAAAAHIRNLLNGETSTVRYASKISAKTRDTHNRTVVADAIAAAFEQATGKPV